MIMQKKNILATLAISIALQLPIRAAEPNVITLAESQPYESPSAAVQHISESINLVKGQEKLNLTLTYYNGSSTLPPFRWLRISSPSMNYVTEKAFIGGVYVSDVTGELTWGGNQLLITGDGPRGATFAWKLTTQRPSIIDISPQVISPGSKVVISGSNFCTDTDSIDVEISGKKAQCVSATADKLVVQVPEGTKGGATSVKVNVAGLDAGTLSCSINAVPYLKSLSRAWLPPGAALTIYGEGFSPNVNKTVVFIGPLQAPVVSATTDSITVIAPADFGGMPWGYYMPVKVMINGVRARNQLTVSCSEVG